MKKLIVISLLTMALNIWAAPISPMDNYQPTVHAKSELNRFWKKIESINTKMKGKDCFKRAMIWSYTLNKHNRVDSKKVYMHYTNKFNREIDDMGRSGAGALFGRVLSRNKGWDFHVAPVVNIEGTDYVLDPHLRKGPEKTEDWVEFLTERGEYRLKIRHNDLLDDLDKARRRLARSIRSKSTTAVEIASARDKVVEIEAKLKELGLTENRNQKIDIKCRKIDNIMEFDANQDTEWCFYQEASMYYYGPLQLRLLNYGYIDLDLRLPVMDMTYHTETYFADGAKYIYRNFDRDQLEESLDEFKLADKPESIYEL